MSSSPTLPPKNPSRFSAVDPSSIPTTLHSASQQPGPSKEGYDAGAGQAVPTIVVTKQPVDTAALEKQESISSDSSDGNAKLYPVRPTVKSTHSSASVWPTKQELQAKALMSKKERMRRNCYFFGQMSQQQRVWARVLLALLAICAAVGIGVGISLAVGGGVYKSQGQQSTIPNPNGS